MPPGFKKGSKGKRERLVYQVERTLSEPIKKTGGSVALHKVANEKVETIWGKSFIIGNDEDKTQTEANLGDIIKLLINNMRVLRGQKITFNDDEQALLVAQALRGASNGYITFEETPYKWLMELTKNEGSKLLSPHTVMVVKALEAEVKE